MKYFKQYKGTNEVSEITADEAYHTLSGFWEEDFLADIFNNQKPFRLFTAYSEVWTEKEGLVPMAGFYGTVG